MIETEELPPPAPLPPMPRPRPRRRRAGVVVLSVLLAVVLLAGGASAWVERQLNPPGAAGPDVEVTIPPGATTADIARRLEAAGVITNARVFRFYVRFRGGAPFRSGEYTFRRHDDMSRVRRILAAGPKIKFDRLTIPEGFSLAQIAERVGALPGHSAQRFLDLARSGTARSALVPPGFTNLEGLLFPDTYMFREKKDDDFAILTRLLAQFDDVATGAGVQDAPRLVGVTPYQAVIVASLVEREAKVDEDRGPIARVIYNRLQRGMPLQVDATVQYARGQQKQRLSLKDIEIDSPYNTYKIKGLPPGPIASPGLKSLEAALDPTPGSWLYYVLADVNGKHAFATTPAEFERLKSEAHRKGLL